MSRWMNLLAVLVVITAISRPDAEATSSVVLTPTVALTTEIPVDINDSDDAVDDSDDSDDSNDSDDSDDAVDDSDDSDDSNDSDDSDDAPTGLKIGADVKTVDKIVSTYKNWVGPSLGKPDRSDSACYREAHIMSTCPVAFDYKLKTCWTECPLSHPVECGIECIRQSDDCALEVISKFTIAKEYIRIVTDKVMTSIALLDKDVTRITSLLAEYIQPICGPTQFIGEIDDGTSTDTLGLKVVGKAFNASSLSWARVGDGVVTIKFVSVDKEDVTVNIMSGGDKYAEVDVSAGKVVTWKSNVTDLGGRTLYLDRWRPGFLGLPGTGGGSLKLWVPRASEGGHLDLTAKINVS
ncbi:hypothetical protein BBJ29_009722 [Phytophthora kernoviae]|uniref:Uncharacterized protein n=1 Tax=Phytophthora kernoviae TaxID=325452 RepID=A0A421FH38_9STRA|nr:hypothetical protein BBJ29_009722 [Phytophthora kernoviae]